MHRRSSFIVGIIGVVALFAVNTTVDLQAQRGGGARVDRGGPPTPGQGRPVTAGRPDGAGRPATPPTKPEHPDKPTKPDHPDKPVKPDRPDAHSGRPTVTDQLTRNTALMERLKSLFPEGTNLADASKDYKNLGQFVAAAHVANNNPNFTFDELKAKMTGDHPMSLGQAIHALDPSADAKAEERAAKRAADRDIKAARRVVAGT